MELTSTPVEMSRSLPDGWELCPVGKMGEVVTGKALAKNAPGEQRPYLRTKNVFDGRIDIEDVLTMPMTDAEFEHFKVVVGDVLLNEGQSLELVGRCATYNDEYSRPCAIQNQLVRFRARPGVSGDFASHLFRYCQRTGVFAKIALKTTSIAHLGGKRFENLELPWPTDESEQKTIANALSDVDALLDGLDRLITKKRDLKRAAMQQLLTGKTRLPGFTKPWAAQPLAAVGHCIRGVSYDGDRDLFPHDTSDSVRLLRANNVQHTRIHTNDLQYVRASRVSDAQRLVADDIVICMANGSKDLVGKAGAFTVEDGHAYTFGAFMACFRPDRSKADPGFVFGLFGTEAYRHHLHVVLAGSSINNLRPGQIESLEYLVPEREEQEAIARVFSDMDAEIDTLERRRAKTHDIKNAMMQELLTGKTRLVGRELPAAQEASASDKPSHNWAFNEAVVISTLVSRFGKEDYPLGRKRYTKLSYLLHRRVERRAEGYLKKAAGPYNPQTKYGGPEKIAKANGYILQHKGSKGHSGFIAADNIAQAEGYFEKWYGPDVLQWLEQFRFKKNDDLEVLATVDMATVELHEAGTEVNVASVTSVIANHPEWEAKLDRAAFSDANIAAAIEVCGELFSEAVH